MSDTISEFVQAYEFPFYMGIDPGATGGIGLLSYCGQALAFDIPTSKVPRKGGTTTVFDHQKIVTLFDELESVVYPASVKICLEEGVVQVVGKGANAYTGFRVGCGYAMWPLFLVSRHYSLLIVHPASWKSTMKLKGLDKEQIRLKTLKLFPNAEITRKMDHNRAEALMLALYRKSQGI